MPQLHVSVVPAYAAAVHSLLRRAAPRAAGVDVRPRQPHLHAEPAPAARRGPAHYPRHRRYHPGGLAGPGEGRERGEGGAAEGTVTAARCV